MSFRPEHAPLSGEVEKLVSIENVIGGGGKDTLIGSAGNNTLSGGPGDDVMTGGLGKDQFSASTGNDTITDFNPKEDSLWVPQLAGGFIDGTPAGKDTIVAYGVGEVEPWGKVVLKDVKLADVPGLAPDPQQPIPSGPMRTFNEVEPNDTRQLANDLSKLAPGEAIHIVGDANGTDDYFGYVATAAGPIEVYMYSGDELTHAARIYAGQPNEEHYVWSYATSGASEYDWYIAC